MPAKISFVQKVVNDAAQVVSDVFYKRVYGEILKGEQRSNVWDQALMDLKDQLDLVHSVKREGVYIHRYLIALAIQVENLEGCRWPRWAAVMENDYEGHDHPWIHLRQPTPPSGDNGQVTTSLSVLSHGEGLDKRKGKAVKVNKGKGKAMEVKPATEEPSSAMDSEAEVGWHDQSGHAAMQVEEAPHPKRSRQTSKETETSFSKEQETQGCSRVRAAPTPQAQHAQSRLKPPLEADSLSLTIPAPVMSAIPTTICETCHRKELECEVQPLQPKQEASQITIGISPPSSGGLLVLTPIHSPRHIAWCWGIPTALYIALYLPGEIFWAVQMLTLPLAEAEEGSAPRFEASAQTTPHSYCHHQTKAPPLKATIVIKPWPTPQETVVVKAPAPRKQIFKGIRIPPMRKKGEPHIVPTARARTRTPPASTPTGSITADMLAIPSAPPAAPNTSQPVTFTSLPLGPSERFTVKQAEWKQVLDIAQGLVEWNTLLQIHVRTLEERIGSLEE
ncbi:hypothetical protein OG21DRAFT_1487270 [Imleria badia]|nr:hypothetical protein OG21DRAFT_1487270 [Imleria badia]